MIPIAKPVMDEEKAAVLDVLDSGMLAQGEKVKEFENDFAEYIGVKHSIAVSNGTTALLTAINCLGIRGKVLVPSFTFFASVSTIALNGLDPVFVDIDPQTFNMDPEDLKEKITPDTEAVMPVHLFGQSCEMNAIKELCEDHGLKLIEDACQSHGAMWDGEKVGTFGTGCFSFYPTKNITTGEGGMITTNDDSLARKIRLFINHGQSTRYEHTSWGYNYRMTNIQAAIGKVQLSKLEEFIIKRRENAKYYDKHLQGVQTPKVLDKAYHVYHQYTLRVENREEIIQKFKENGIGYGIYYPIPAHKQPIVDSSVQLPETEKACKEVLSIPVHPFVTREGVHEIVSVVNGD